MSSRFRTDLFFYQLGVIVPGISNFAVILILKKYLSPEDFGFYSLRFALIFLLSAFSVGWLTQSVLRLLAAEGANKILLLKSILVIGFSTLSLLGIAASTILSLYFNDQYLEVTLLYFALVTAGIYAILISYTQANFKPKSVLLSELIRSLLFLITGFFAVYSKSDYAVSFLWISIICSNFSGIILLMNKNNLTLSLIIESNITTIFKIHFKQLIKYGGPLGIWLIIWNCMHFLEKPIIMAFTKNYELIGNYQALFDILSKGANLLLLPVSYAIFPHLTLAYEQENMMKAKSLLRKVIISEILLLLLIMVVYSIFGFKLLSMWFNIPNSNEFFLSGLIMLANAIIWQMAVIIHKPLELGKFTFTMLNAMIIALFVYITSLLILPQISNLYLPSFALPALFGGLSYITYISFKIKRLKIFN